MYQSKNIREPSTFGKNPHDDSTRPDIHKDSINAATMSTLNQTAGYGLRCPNGVRDGVYQCEICERLRRVCPISGTQASQTYVRSHQASYSAGHKWENKGNTGFSQQKGKGPDTAHFYTPTKEPRIIQETIYVPVIHNILVPQYLNPEKRPQNDLSFSSPQYKHRHRSGTTGEPQSSPIRVEQYYAGDEILTPSKLKQLTESMIA